MFTRTLLFLFVLLTISCAFDKNLLKKGRKNAGYEKHPISRRVLRFDRSAEFPTPSEFPFAMLDYVKIIPEIPVKYKPSHVMRDMDYNPELEF
ncbi:hypothetical protein KIN20_000246 [Parelaphostrongylus tenuis]|uniref:Uncharacterized protein n=1 Tax=Parelaphostrongylus tenuis TaxID=148309 RepID=A0AAD5QBP4_PARTN|nr:hypothetical protein KIN20_000246 [Parelaphostrongylus tenuis]